MSEQRIPASEAGCDFWARLPIAGKTLGLLPGARPAVRSCVASPAMAAKPQEEWWDCDMPADRHPVRSMARTVKWFRDNW